MSGAFFPPLGIEDNAKFSIAFVLKVSLVFYPLGRCVYLEHSWNILKVMNQNLKIAINFLFYFDGKNKAEMFFGLNNSMTHSHGLGISSLP